MFSRFALLLLILSLVLGGCVAPPPGQRGPLVQSITPDEYGERLCRHLDLEEYSACLSEVLGYFETHQPNALADGRHSTSGPIALILQRQVYLGQYAISPLAARFRVTRGQHWCEGSYNAMTGSPDAIHVVICSDGRRGRAELTSDLDGRNGIGELELNDGTRADLVFGYRALGLTASQRAVSYRATVL